MRFIDSVLLTSSGKIIKVKPGSYENFNFRFSGAQAGATAPTEATLGALDIYYRGNPRAHLLFTELGIYNDKKGGAREVTVPAGDTQPFAWNYIWSNHHPDDKDNILYVKDAEECYMEWTPLATLAGRVSAASQLRVTASERLGTMRYFYGWKRTDISMVAGDTTPQDLLPYNISSVFVEYNANIDNLDLTVDGRMDQQSAEIVELLNQDLQRNRIETYAASGFAEIDLLKSKNPLEALSNHVTLILRGASADTISVYWQYFDYTLAAQQMSESAYDQQVTQVLSNKSATGGNAAIQVVTKQSPYAGGKYNPNFGK